MRRFTAVLTATTRGSAFRGLATQVRYAGSQASRAVLRQRALQSAICWSLAGSALGGLVLCAGQASMFETATLGILIVLCCNFIMHYCIVHLDVLYFAQTTRMTRRHDFHLLKHSQQQPHLPRNMKKILKLRGALPGRPITFQVRSFLEPLKNQSSRSNCFV